MLMGGSFRRRLLVAFMALVVLTVLLVGVGSYVFASFALEQQLKDDSERQARFDIGVLAAERLPAEATREDVESSGLAEAFFLRGAAETVIDFGDGDPYVSAFRFRDLLSRVSPELRALVAQGDLGFERLDLDGEPYLVMAGRRPATAGGVAPNGPDFYLLFSARGVEQTLDQLRQVLLAASAVAVLLALLLGGLLARQVLRPVREAGAAARRIAEGDLSARLRLSGGDEFGAWADSFNRMAASLEDKVAQLEEAQSRQRRFVSDVSHELRTPLTALVNEAGMLREHLDSMPADVRRLGELLATDVSRLRVLVDDLMEISRFDAEAEQVEPADVDLAAFVRALAAARAPEASVRVGGTVFLRTDPRRLERIVGNLLDNARKHAGADGLALEAEVQGGEAIVRVADRGPGVPADALPHLFERFFKADPSRHAGGSGLGLAIARENAELLGGSLVARPRDGGGMVFEVRLPVTPPLRHGDERVTAPDEPAAQTRATRPVTEAQP
jgi:two-component system, OmpR family, sensor histidine kinase MtrB